MDPAVVESLRAAGIDASLDGIVPVLGFHTDGEGGPILPLAESALVVSGEATAEVVLKPISALWTGDARPPDFARGPTREYLLFFALIERTAADYCSCRGKKVRDREFERIYDHLRRRPDAADGGPLFSYLQGAVRLYMSLRDVSRAEFEAVLHRLARSARTFSDGAASTNYHDRALAPLLGPDA